MEKRKLPCISIFFPFYNDAGTVERQISNAYKYGNEVADKVEVIAIHGGNSQDNTFEEIKKQKLIHPDLVIVDKTDNHEGYAVIKHGFYTATCEWIFYTDGDAQYHLEEDLPLLVEAYFKSGADIINGYKLHRQDNMVRILLGEVYKKFSTFLFNLPIKDTDCDFRLIKKSAIDKITLESTDASILPEMILKLYLSNCKFAEIPVNHYQREYGKSNYTAYRLLKEKLIGDLKLYFKKKYLIQNRTEEFNPNDNEYNLMFENEQEHWWYKGLRALLKKYIVKYKPVTILDAGCGSGINLLEVTNNFNGIKVYGCDISKHALELCSKRGLHNLVEASLDKLPYPDKNFDMIYSFDVIGCVEPVKVNIILKEFNRCLKDHGVLIINTAALQSLYSSHDIAWDIRKRYNSRELISLFENGGFSVVKATYRNFFLFIPIFLVKLLNKFKIRLNNHVRQSAGDLKKYPVIINWVLTQIMYFEDLLLNVFSFPIGTSVFVVGVKK